MYAWMVFGLTVCESVFLFIPPEVFMTPAIIANKQRALPITVAAALGSVVGGAIAYFIGMFLFDSVGTWLITTFSSMDQFVVAQNLFDKYGVWIILFAAVTPVPYKLMAMCAGFMGYSAPLFLGLSAILRTGRFAIVAALLWKFQERANAIVKKYFWPLTVVAIVAACLGILLMLLF